MNQPREANLNKKTNERKEVVYVTSTTLSLVCYPIRCSVFAPRRLPRFAGELLAIREKLIPARIDSDGNDNARRESCAHTPLDKMRRMGYLLNVIDWRSDGKK